MLFNSISVSLSKKTHDDLPEYLQGYYNRPVHTNKTVKKPYSCSANHGICFCHMKPKGQNKRKARDFMENFE